MENSLEVMTLQGAEDCFSRNLLPPGAGLFITHDKVLIVDTSEMEMEHSPVYSCFPHQTGVTERSISGNQRSASNGVLNHMVVSHQSNRVSNSLSLVIDCQHHIGISHEFSIACLRICRVG